MNQEGIRKKKKKKKKRSGKELTRTRRGKKNTEAKVPADVIFSEILPRLPASSLVRLRLVCKAWQSVIVDPAFAYTNLKCALEYNRHASQRVMINYYGEGELVLLDEESGQQKTVMETHSRVAPPCNGLFCIYMRDYDEKYDECTLQLFNPTTRELLPLRRPDNSWFCDFYLVFDPFIRRYKVVCHPCSLLQCRVLTVGTDASWRRIGNFGPLVNTKHRCAVVGGHLFRVTRDSESLHNVVVFFDPCEEKFRRLSQLPSSIEDVFDVGGKPCFLEYYGATIFARGLHIWMLMDLDREVWIHKCIMPAIGRDELRFRGFPDAMIRGRPIFLSKEKLILCYHGHLSYLHLQSGGRNVDWEEVSTAGDDQVIYHQAYAYAFVGSLISLKHMLTSIA